MAGEYCIGRKRNIAHDVYKNVLQRAGWALARKFLYTFIFSK
jgi:hypothetical protein